jgi:ATP-dependent Lhr-like helicase
MAAGRSGLLHATTGSGKTYAVWMGALARCSAAGPPGCRCCGSRRCARWRPTPRARCSSRWPTLAPAWTWACAPATRPAPNARGRTAPAHGAGDHARVADADADARTRRRRAGRRAHRGRRRVARADRQQARRAGAAGAGAPAPLEPAAGGVGPVGHAGQPGRGAAHAGRQAAAPLVQAASTSRWSSTPCCRADPGRFSLGRPPGRADAAAGGGRDRRQRGTTLVFTNVRSQAEIWYQLLLAARPDWAGLVALHHGSLDKACANGWRPGLKAGTLKAWWPPRRWTWAWTSCRWSGCCRSAAPRAWRGCCSAPAAAATRPAGPAASPWCPPTRWNWWKPPPRAAPRWPARWSRAHSPAKPLDVLVQHLVTVALGGGLHADSAVRRGAQRPPTATLTRDEFDWALAFVERGGDSLTAYPEYHRIAARETAAGACPTAASRGATGCRWAPSSATRRCW